MPQPETSKNHNADTPQRAVAGRLWAAAAFLVMPLAVYLTAAQIIAHHDSVSVGDVVSLDPDSTPLATIGRKVSAVVMILSAVGFLFVSPGLLGLLAVRRRSSVAQTAHVWSLVGNSVALFMVMLALRHTVGIERLSFVTGWWLWTMCLFVWAWQPQQSPVLLKELCQRWSRTILVGGACILISVVVLFPEQFVQCMNEDGTEAYELARSLQTHTLPAWELETWELGLPSQVGTVVVNPALVNSYWTFGLLTLLGDGELAVRLPFLIWWSAIFVVCCRLIRPKRLGDGAKDSDDWLAVIPVGLLMLLANVLFTFYVGYNPYMADIANPGVQNAIFALAVLCAFECVRHRDMAGFTAVMILASLVLYAGPVMLVLLLAAAWIFQPVSRRQVQRWGAIAFSSLLLLAIIYAAVGLREGVLAAWVDMLDVEYVSDYLAPVSRVHSGLLFAGYFVLGCGGVCVLGMAAVWRGEAWQRTLAAAAFGYLLIVLCSGFKNLHYIGPLLPIPLVLLLSSATRFRRSCCVAASCSILICLALSWPAQRQTFVLNRQLGQLTTFATDDYLDAVQWGRVRFRLQDMGVLPWDCDQHTWVAYSELSGSQPRPRELLVTGTGPRIADYRLIATRPVEGLPVTAAVFVSDPQVIRWLSEQRPMRPEERYPAVFQPLANGPFSPHNNQLEEVRRLQ